MNPRGGFRRGKPELLNHDPNSEISLELKVKVCKIKGRVASPLVQSSSDLHEYVNLLDLIDEAKTTGEENPLTWAIQEAVRRNIMRDYLERKGGEVLSILTAEYDFDTAIAVKQEEAYASGLSVGREEGREEGISIGLDRGMERGAYQKALETAKAFLAEGLSPAMVARCTRLPIETIQELVKD